MRLKSRTNIVGRLDLVDEVRAGRRCRPRPGPATRPSAGEKSVAPDADLFAERLLEGRAEDQADVLDGVVVVHLDVALGLYRQVEQPVLGEKREHVVEERHARVDLGRPAAVDRKGDRDVGLRRPAGDGRYAGGASLAMRRGLG